MLFRNVLFDSSRQFLIQFFRGPAAVQQEVAPFFQAGHDIVFVNVRLIVNRHVIRIGDQIGFHDGFLTETQVGYGNTAGLFGVVGKIALGIHVRMVADNFDSALISANSAVGTQAPELAALGSLGSGIDNFCLRQGGMVHIIFNTYGETVLRFILPQVFDNGIHVGRSKLLGTQTEAPAYDSRMHVALVESVADVQI